MLKKKLIKNIFGLNEIRTHDLFDIGAVLYQLSYQASSANNFVNSQFTRKT